MCGPSAIWNGAGDRLRSGGRWLRLLNAWDWVSRSRSGLITFLDEAGEPLRVLMGR